MNEQSKLTTWDYLPRQEFYLHFWTREQVEQAMEALGIGLDQVSELKGFQTYPAYLKPCELVRKGIVPVLATATPRGMEHQQASGYVPVQGYLCRVSQDYFHPYEVKIIKHLLYQAVPELEPLSFTVYGPSVGGSAEHYEIYLPVGGGQGSLYCPFRCLLARDWEGVVRRHMNYHKDYFNTSASIPYLNASLALIDHPDAQLLRLALQEPEQFRTALARRQLESMRVYRVSGGTSWAVDPEWYITDPEFYAKKIAKARKILKDSGADEISFWNLGEPEQAGFIDADEELPGGQIPSIWFPQSYLETTLPAWSGGKAPAYVVDLATHYEAKWRGPVLVVSRTSSFLEWVTSDGNQDTLTVNLFAGELDYGIPLNAEHSADQEKTHD